MLQTTVKNRTIFCRDNLDVLQNLNSSSIDLIYLDPPFNKNKIFTAPIGSSAEGASFKDIFREEDVKDEWLITIQEDHEQVYEFLDGVKRIEGKKSYNFCYLAYMAIRLIELHRILKDTGSIYLHCDPTMSHYLKLLLDFIFAENNFRNEIVWKRVSYKFLDKYAKSNGCIIESLLFYTKKDKPVFYKTKIHNEDYKKDFKHKDSKGIYRAKSPLFSNAFLHKSPRFEWNGLNPPHGWALSLKKVQELSQENRIHYNSKGTPYTKEYIEEYEGIVKNNLWDDIGIARGKERVGYPTQKPVKLLERIIRASSNEGDVVLDPFCGCATTCIAAEKLGRQWIGVDVSVRAYELVKERLQTEVANPENLLQYQNEVHYSTTPPVRSDQDDILSAKKYIYIISHKNYPGEYKVGIAKNHQARLNSYQTSDPDRNYRLEYHLHTPRFRETEKHILETFPNKHEWVCANLKEVIKAIEQYNNP